MEMKREEHLVVAAGKVVVVVTEEDEGCFRGVAAANASLLSFLLLLFLFLWEPSLLSRIELVDLRPVRYFSRHSLFFSPLF
ncbi:hypothetical protein Csa_013364 [Cucumis sativus]|uniref:Uncharacterized protein n=1 Tax=Cucumis sativus TaxID=3659 RepID=A0A0A0LT29_CUCSA|nr:hypothetical protein Csa_013364 [Cucumis sativus]